MLPTLREISSETSSYSGPSNPVCNPVCCPGSYSTRVLVSATKARKMVRAAAERFSKTNEDTNLLSLEDLQALQGWNEANCPSWRQPKEAGAQAGVDSISV